MKRFAALDPARFEAIFGDEALASSRPDAPVARRVAELALTVPRVEYQSFALDHFYETARDTADFHRLRALAGSVDAMGMATAGALAARVHRQKFWLAGAGLAALAAILLAAAWTTGRR